MRTIFVLALLFFRVMLFAQTGCELPDTAVTSSLKSFYAGLRDDRIFFGKLDSLNSQHITAHGQAKLKRLAELTDYDHLIDAQDTYVIDLPTFQVVPLGDSWFCVSFTHDKGGDDEKQTDVTLKVVKTKDGKYKIDDIKTHVDTTLTDNNTIVNAKGLILPEFAGGKEALQKYMNDNLRYPSYAIRNNQEGRAVISFVVRKDGKLCNIYNIYNARTDIPCLDHEALRVVRNMPYWKPGYLNGKAVNVQYTLPVSFVLTNR